MTELRVRDLAVIADVTLPLKPGLNVLTGETGAGKSMLVDALALLLGERASADVVRPGADKTVIEALFGDDLVLKREVTKEGRSRVWINGSPATVGMLAEVGAKLVDLHGQHETQSLLKPDAQRDILDAYAGAQVERVAVRDAHQRLHDLEQRESELTARQDEVRRKADYLRHVVQEIEKAAPKVGEDDALETDAKRLAHADELGRLARELEETLDSAVLARAHKILAALAKVDPSTARWQELLDTATANAQELAQTARDYASGIEADPSRLAAVEQRRDLLFRLQQKYGPSIPDILATRDSSARELELLDTADLDLRNLADDRANAAAEFRQACAALSKKRFGGSERLSRAVNELLPALGMAGGTFTARIQSRPTPHSHGHEDVVFDVALNAGMEARPLARVASGGELSRLMLALKVVLSAHDAVPTLVFDEVDQGIGGEVGVRVGEALARVAGAERQALVITHLPQIAAYADHHLRVTKAKKGGVATSDVEVVEGEARVKEIGRMLGDADMETALRHAAELLRTASAKSASRSETRSPQGSNRRSR
ncbi:MAG TPA: DNA repair protein RecN [Gemmatimonadales bacterium]|nr:DNA repair protein RecN [Gemmatimonadales bacterium]